MGFVRRFSSFPPASVLTAIEGIDIIDLPPPGNPSGVSVNVIALVGEFADMSYAVSVDASGVFTTNPQPVEVFGGQDLVNKVGGFDATIGQFGGAMGNGFVELRNKKFGRLVVCPVNLCSAAGIRLWRFLPTNKSATDPTPVVPVVGASVPAGYLLKDSAQVLERMKVGARVQFSNAQAYLTGVDGSVTNAAAAATATFTSAGGGFSTFARPDGQVGVQVGDILVTGVIGLAGHQGDDAGQHRVVSVTSDTVIVVQAMDGANFAWTTTAVDIAWRIHPAAAADSYGQGLLSSQGTYTVPVRPLTNDGGTGSSGSDGSWATGTALSPVVAPPALTATFADPLSGLAGKVGPTTAVAFTHLIQRPNAANDSTIDALYVAAIAAFTHDDVPESEVNHLWAARKSSTIRNTLLTHELAHNQVGIGRTVSASPNLDLPEVSSLTTVTGNADPGVGANRDESYIYDWPAVQTFVPEAVGSIIATADGSTTTDGILDVTSDGWMASILGNLDFFRNPGEASATTKAVLAPVLGYARGTPKLDMNAWILLRQRGIAGIRMDRTVGPVFQSGVTTSLTDGQKNINRRRTANFIEDSLGEILMPFSKLPQSNQMQDAATGEVHDFLEGLVSPDNPSAQEIDSFIVDDKTGNTQETEAQGLFVIIVKVRTLPTADFIVVQASIGEGVVTTTSTT